jgi:hypothetical protein
MALFWLKRHCGDAPGDHILGERSMFWRRQSILIAPAIAGPTKTAGQRVDAIDFWRGFALLTIFIDHLPDNVFQQMTYGNFGLSDAAELFVFLSGASVALAYGTRFFHGERRAAI